MKKGSVGMLPPWLVNLMYEALVIGSVVFIIGGFGVAVHKILNPPAPQEPEFEKISTFSDTVIKNFEDKKLQQPSFTYPISSIQPFMLEFYPETGGTAKPPAECRGKTCIAIYYLVKDKQKIKYKILGLPAECKRKNCEELCAGPYASFNLKQDDRITIAIQCTTEGSEFTVSKV